MLLGANEKENMRVSTASVNFKGKKPKFIPASALSSLQFTKKTGKKPKFIPAGKVKKSNVVIKVDTDPMDMI